MATHDPLERLLTYWEQLIRKGESLKTFMYCKSHPDSRYRCVWQQYSQFTCPVGSLISHFGAKIRDNTGNVFAEKWRERESMKA